MPDPLWDTHDLVRRAESALEALRSQVLHPLAREGLPGDSWTYRNRKIGEWGVAQTLADELRSRGLRQYSDIVPRLETSPATPPDAIGRNESGGLVGFEVTEIVSPEAIAMNITQRNAARQHLEATASADELALARTSGRSIEFCVSPARREEADAMFSSVHFLWDATKLAASLTDIIARKDDKVFAEAGETYEERLLVIHTDEVAINQHAALGAVESIAPRLRHLTSVWLVLSFRCSPQGHCCYPIYQVA